MHATKFSKHNTTLSLWMEGDSVATMHGYSAIVLAHLRSRGFTFDFESNIELAGGVAENFGIESNVIDLNAHRKNVAESNVLDRFRGHYDHCHAGFKNGLQVDVVQRDRHLDIVFYQAAIKAGDCAVRFDVEQRVTMPYLVGLQVDLEMLKLADLMRSRGIALESKVDIVGGRGVGGGVGVGGALEQIRRRQRYGILQPTAKAGLPLIDSNARSANPGCSLYDGAPVYFRGKDDRWSIGEAYHNNGDRWILLLPCGTEHTCVGTELHRARPQGSLQGRQILPGEVKRRQMAAQNKARLAGDIKRVCVLRTLLTPEDAYYVISVHHTKKEDAYITLWCQSDRGYRYALHGAGKYARTDVSRHLNYYNQGENIAVDAETVERLAKQCAPGSPGDKEFGAGVVVLHNLASVWRSLLSNTIAPPIHDVVPALLKKPIRKPRQKNVAA